jgi:hypothetical protein
MAGLANATDVTVTSEVALDGHLLGDGIRMLGWSDATECGVGISENALHADHLLSLRIIH